MLRFKTEQDKRSAIQFVNKKLQEVKADQAKIFEEEARFRNMPQFYPQPLDPGFQWTKDTSLFTRYIVYVQHYSTLANICKKYGTFLVLQNDQQSRKYSFHVRMTGRWRMALEEIKDFERMEQTRKAIEYKNKHEYFVELSNYRRHLMDLKYRIHEEMPYRYFETGKL